MNKEIFKYLLANRHDFHKSVFKPENENNTNMIHEKDDFNIFSPENRVKYYLGNLIANTKINIQITETDKTVIIQSEHRSILNTPLVIPLTDKLFNSEVYTHSKYIISNTFFSEENLKCKIPYVHDLNNYLKNYYNDNSDGICNNESYGNYKIDYFIFYFGDRTDAKKFPCFVKARKIGTNDYSVILNLNYMRHTCFIPVVKKYDIPFNEKMNKILWRGDSTGSILNNCLREKLVYKYQNHPNQDIDIKYTNISEFIQNKDFEFIVSPFMPVQKQLYYKYIISIEGNDVASNLKWILYSNSVVLMPKPKCSSWYMEDKLVPWVHYVPLDDSFDDLEEKFNWCLENDDICTKIAQNGKEFMMNFMDTESENIITKMVIKKYFEKVKLIY
jgi:hypothetical protein